MLQLKNGCRCSDIKVIPSNWDKSGASTKQYWYIYYRYYNPEFKGTKEWGKLVRLFEMNEYHLLPERRNATKAIIEQELYNLKELEYNPITGFILDPKTEDDVPEELRMLEFDPRTPILAALARVERESSYSANIKANFRSVLKYFAMATTQLRLEETPICEVNKKHIKAILMRCGKIKADKWTPRTFNYYKAHLSMMFTYLDKEDVIDSNPMKSIDAMTTVKKIRDVLTDDQRARIDEDLRKEHFDFWLVLNLFFHSGARGTEFIRLKKEDVYLDRMQVKYLVKKGGAYREVMRPIKLVALPLWEMAYYRTPKGYCLFGEGFKPAQVGVQSEVLTRSYKKWVKDAKDDEGNPRYGDNIADWYALKKLNTTETSDIIGTELAAKHNAHSEEILKKHYDGNIKKREDAILIGVANSFAPTKEKAAG